MNTEVEPELTKKERKITFIVGIALFVGLTTWLLVEFGRYLLGTFRWAATTGTSGGEWLASLPLPLGLFLASLILGGSIGVLYLLYKLMKWDVGKLRKLYKGGD